MQFPSYRSRERQTDPVKSFEKQPGLRLLFYQSISIKMKNMIIGAI